MPRGKKFTAEQIIGKLREAEAEAGLAQGKTVPEVVRKRGVTEQTYERWKRVCGGLRTDQAKRLKDLEKENARLADARFGRRDESRGGAVSGGAAAVRGRSIVARRGAAVATAAAAIAATQRVVMLSWPRFCDRSAVRDLGRFSRYWQKVATSALRPTDG